MAKVIKHGDSDPNEPIPAGLNAKCGHCGCEFITDENDQQFAAAHSGEERFEDPQKTKPVTGWYMNCPECMLSVYIKR